LYGECLVLIPKPDSYRIACKHAIEEIKTYCEENFELEEIENIPEHLMEKAIKKLPADFKEFADPFLALEDDKVVYKPEYLQGALGGIKIDDRAKGRFFNFETGLLNYFCVASLPKGRIFGEMGLLQNKPRAATIVAKDEVSLAVINKRDYEKI